MCMVYGRSTGIAGCNKFASMAQPPMAVACLLPLPLELYQALYHVWLATKYAHKNAIFKLDQYSKFQQFAQCALFLRCSARVCVVGVCPCGVIFAHGAFALPCLLALPCLASACKYQHAHTINTHIFDMDNRVHSPTHTIIPFTCSRKNHALILY